MNPNTTGDLRWWMDVFTFYRGSVHAKGWAFHTGQPIRRAEWKWPSGERRPLPDFEPSPDVAGVFGDLATHCRISDVLPVDGVETAMRLNVVFTLADGTELEITNLVQPKRVLDPFHALATRFFGLLGELPAGKVVEIGSRSRSGNVQRGRVPEPLEYIGFDIREGGNVDVVGDAHALSEVFALNSLDAVFGTSVFEHLIMPWKAALEINRVLKPGGLVFLATHQTFPLHEQPWDFFRFSDQSWHGLFNRFTGFEIIQTALGEQASIVAHLTHPAIAGLEQLDAFIGSAVLARKTGETRLAWEVDAADLVKSIYPH